VRQFIKQSPYEVSREIKRITSRLYLSGIDTLQSVASDRLAALQCLSFGGCSSRWRSLVRDSSALMARTNARRCASEIL